MKLPKIKNEDLPQELREILGDNDAEFDAIVDPTDIIDVQLDPDSYFEAQPTTAELLIESRKTLEEFRQPEQKVKKPKNYES